MSVAAAPDSRTAAASPGGARSARDPLVIVALDFPDAAAALAMAGRLDPRSCGVKVGKELFTAAGPALVEALVARGFRVFLDLKYHDIPNTVAGACAAATRLGVWMLNVHASGGRAMLEAARRACHDTARSLGRTPPKVIAVTVLTSLGGDDLEALGIAGTPAEAVLRFARLAQDAGLDGVVCSAQESAALRAALGTGFLLVTPGIRPAEASLDDHARPTTPKAAVDAGSSHLVIGRPITGAADPAAALAAINASIGSAP